MNASLFADFDQAAVAAIVAERERELQADGAARAARTAQRRQMRHAKGEASLAELLPARLADGESWHYYLAIESSANVNTNPRIEQTAMHRSRELFQFYREFFRDLRSIDSTRKGA